LSIRAIVSAAVSLSEWPWKTAHLACFSTDTRSIARVTSTGGWLSLEQRRMVPPPEELADIMRGLARSADFEDLR